MYLRPCKIKHVEISPAFKIIPHPEEGILSLVDAPLVSPLAVAARPTLL
jgi:hypothetical protein